MLLVSTFSEALLYWLYSKRWFPQVLFMMTQWELRLDYSRKICSLCSVLLTYEFVGLNSAGASLHFTRLLLSTGISILAGCHWLRLVLLSSSVEGYAVGCLWLLLRHSDAPTCLCLSGLAFSMA